MREYQHGDTFGELALMYNSPRKATIKVPHSNPLDMERRPVPDMAIDNRRLPRNDGLMFMCARLL